MKNITLLLFFLMIFCGGLAAQDKMEYINPPTIQHDIYTLDIEDIVAEEDYCKFKLVILNKSESFMAYDISKVGFVYDNLGTYYPKKKKIVVVPPNKKIVSTIKISGNMNYMVSHFSLNLEGLSYAPVVESTYIDSLPLEEGKVVKNDYLELEVEKFKCKKGKCTFKVQGRFTGKDQDFCVIDAEGLSIVNEANEVVDGKLTPKKLQLLQDGKKINILGNFESEDEKFTIYWNDIYKKYTLFPEAPKTVQIHQVGTPPVKATELHPATTGCAAVTGNTSGKARVNFFNSEKKCFKMFVNGALISNEYSANITCNMGPGKKRIEYHFPNGHVLKDNLVIQPNVLEVSYRLKPKGNSYSVNMLLGSVVTDNTTPFPANNIPTTTTTTRSRPTFRASSTTTVNGRVVDHKSIEIN